ncbi:sphingolipid transporter [Aureococcus anophagefferens]|uniref:Sphingolipid transporter n=1 Tax=Aureococcus anophagefferens TaxID=44056 RepID=A0ABR1GDK9_AURAN
MSAPPAPRAAVVKRRITLAVLTLVNSTNFWQRNLLYALASVWPPNCLDTCEGATFVPICSSCGAASLGSESEDTCRACQECRIEEESEFYSLRDAACMSDAQYGLLASVSFTIMFAASGLVAGHLTDRLDARKLHAGAVLVWSLSSFVKVVSPNFKLLVCMRLIMGVAQGFNAPCSYPVIAYHFSMAERATANGTYSMGTYFGSALSTLSLIFAMWVGWRMTTTAAVVVGIFAAALLYLTVDRPPQRYGATDGSETMVKAIGNAVRYVRRTSRLAVLYGSTSLRMTATVSLWTYLPSYYARAFPRNEVAFSLIYASATLVCGALSSSVGGAIADRWAKTHSGAHGFLPAVGALLSIGPTAAMFYVPSFSASVCCLLVVILLSECWLGPCMGLLIKDVPPHMTGTQVALLLVCNQLLASLGPWAISLADDGSADIRRPILSVVVTCCLCSGVAFVGLGFMHGEETVAQQRPTYVVDDDHRSVTLLPGRDLINTETAALLANKTDPPDK